MKFQPQVQTIYEDDVFEETDEDEVVAREDDDSDYVPTPIKRKLERLENKNKRRTQVLQVNNGKKLLDFLYKILEHV